MSDTFVSNKEAHDAVRTLIRFIGDDPQREGLVDTPRRVVDMLAEFRDTHSEELSLTAFDHSQVGNLVVVRGIPFASLCEHHMAAFQGEIHCGYLTEERILGLSKFARLVRKHSSGLMVQERMTQDIAMAIADAAQTPHVAVISKATHSCMYSRGVRAFGSETIASSMLGNFRDRDSLRAEFLSLVRP